ncbi:MAG: hypothetical protein HY717_13645 [Planctomycetes bacterium]|nr:hypothetical protein [Planctomycetota bacterium]
MILIIPCLFLAGRTVVAQVPSFTLGFELEGIPCGGKIAGRPGANIPVVVYAVLTQEHVVVNRGAAGWSIGFKGEGAELRFLPGTAASGRSCSTGEQITPLPDFFCDITVVDPMKFPDSGSLAGGPQGEGVVDGLGLQIGKTLEGDGTIRIAKVVAEVTVPPQDSEEARLYYADGLQGWGQPVKNGVAIRGVWSNVDGPPPPLILQECRFTVEALPPVQRPGDFSQNGVLDIDDPIYLLWHLFLGASQPPCAGGLESPGNRELLDATGDGDVDLADALANLWYLFLGGPPHILGNSCRSMPGCPFAAEDCP